MRRFFLLSLLLQVAVNGQHLACDESNRRPEGHSPYKQAGDGGFRVLVVGEGSGRRQYLPNQVYTVTVQGLKTRYSTQKFTEFLLEVESDKQAMMGPSGLVTTGIFHIMDDRLTRFSDLCPDGVTSTNRQPKAEASVLWTAPSVLVASCVTFKATVVERPHVWYQDDGQLTLTLCPAQPTQVTTTPRPVILWPNPPTRGTTTPIPVPPPSRQQSRNSNNNNRPTLPSPTTPTPITAGDGECCACDEAKYDLLFEGLWSKETHPKDFPENEWLLHFSDIIGSSHSKNLRVWELGTPASEGIRQVAEWGSTRALENELKGRAGEINTIIKARGLWHPNERGTSSAAFRVDRTHPFVSLVSMIGPSPDWIVGLDSVPLCLPDCSWLQDKTIELFPIDAGTDSGITYMSPNTPTNPQASLSVLNSSQPNDPRSPFFGLQNLPPFARVVITRQRIYPRNCSDPPTEDHQLVVSENTDDDINRPECAVSEWTAWSECSVRCGKGLRMRKRSYLLPMKADMFRCDRQLVEKEMCLGAFPTCPDDEDEDLMEKVESVCAVTAWSDWSPCSGSDTCTGAGTRSRWRRYKQPGARKKCSLPLTQEEPCVAPTHLNCTEECPHLSPWSIWSPCSVPCGDGVRERSRVLLQQDPEEETCRNPILSQTEQCIGEYGPDCLSGGVGECESLPDPGPCRDNMLRYYWNADKRMCLPFTWGGCKGNRNRFITEQECLNFCNGQTRQMNTQGFTTPELTTPRTTTTTTTTEASTTTPYYYLFTSPMPITERNSQPSLFQWEIPLTTPSYWNFLEISNVRTEGEIETETTSTTRMPTSTAPTTTTTAEPVTVPATSNIPSSVHHNLDSGEDDHHHLNVLDLSAQQQLVSDSVDCVVSPWSEWSACSATCGSGTRQRIRTIMVPAMGEGRRCPRKLVKRKPCPHLPSCP